MPVVDSVVVPIFPNDGQRIGTHCNDVTKPCGWCISQFDVEYIRVRLRLHVLVPAGKDELKDRPEAENLLNIYAALADQDRDAVIAQFAGQQFSGFKTELADLTVAKLAPLAAEMRRLLADPAEIDRILKDGASRARAIAVPVMDEVKKQVGFIS